VSFGSTSGRATRRLIALFATILVVAALNVVMRPSSGHALDAPVVSTTVPGGVTCDVLPVQPMSTPTTVCSTPTTQPPAESTTTTSTTVAPASTTTTTVVGAPVDNGASDNTTVVTDTSSVVSAARDASSSVTNAVHASALSSDTGAAFPEAVIPQAPVLVAPAASVGDPTAGLVAGPRSTIGVLDQLATLGLSPALIARIFAPFPVAGRATYTDDFLEPRTAPTPHLHQGIDIVANTGTPVVASGAGVVRLSSAMSGDDPDGGNAINLVTADGTRYYYAHLDHFTSGLNDGQQVAQGDILGVVGSTGDATGPHLHFEIHPNDGAAIDPASSLDRWLAQAAATAKALRSGPLSVTLPKLGLTGTPKQARPSLHTHLASDASASHALTSTASLPMLALTLAGLSWIVIRRRQRRVLARELTSPVAVDPSDPLWSAVAASTPMTRREAKETHIRAD
jgi:murein DD-endopeptidase MepM/ murein hydrolase activator NlpD